MRFFMYFDIAIFAGIGILAGFFSGLFGIGGGIITTPGMYMVFTRLQKQDTHAMHVAIATTLACMIFTTLSSSYFHHRKKAVNWPTTWNMIIGVFIGSFFGAYVSKLLSNDILKIVFGAFLLLLGGRFFFARKKADPNAIYSKPSIWVLSSMGTGISFISSLVGIGGGLFTVPTLMAFKMRIQNAIATSSSISFFVSIFATTWYVIFGFSKEASSTSLGFISLPAFVTIAIFSVCLAPVGVKVAHLINTKLLKKIFGALVTLIGFYMIFS
ncbi:MAG: hypothetical protein S4CHLAM37_14880 [Chlamydiia bacterium]|nr:hypothetical protein [Chlamydiia bacterium]